MRRSATLHADIGSVEPPRAATVGERATGAPVAPMVAALAAKRRSPWRRRLAVGRGSLPAGGLFAVVLVLAIHVVVATWLVPQPLPGEKLARKIEALTVDARPTLIIAGDSRAACHVIPQVLADELGIPLERIANIARPVCGPSAVLAAYRAYRDRFGAHPVMVLSAAPWCVNDRPAELAQTINDETLWSAGLFERFRLAPPRRALTATFLPEKALGARWAVRRSCVQDVPERGYQVLTQTLDPSPQVRAQDIRRTWAFWYDGADTGGIRWRLLEESLRGLQAEGVRVVMLDVAMHPAFDDAIVETATAQAAARYRARLQDLADRLNVTVLRYEVDSFAKGADPDMLYQDLSHLNRAGATLLSRRLAVDLRASLVPAEVDPH